MGELRAYVLPSGALRTVLTGGPAQRDRVLGAVRRVRPPAPPPPLGPVFTRVPGTPVLRDDDPVTADLDRLLGGGPVPDGRLRATWRLVETVAAGLATASARARGERPAGLRPLGLALADPADAVAGTWTADRARDVPGLRHLVPDDASELVVFWSARTDRGPTA